MMSMNLMGRLLIRQKGRESEGVKYLKASESMRSSIPYWWATLESIYVHPFVLK